MRGDASAQGHADSTAVRRAIWSAVVLVAVIVIGVLALIYAGRVLWLTMMATEGDVPPASALALSEGAEVIGESSDCASGGCWALITVQPAEGQATAELAEEMGATPQLTIPGSFLDPRTIWVSARPIGSVLTLTADYWSGEYVP